MCLSMPNIYGPNWKSELELFVISKAYDESNETILKSIGETFASEKEI